MRTVKMQKPGQKGIKELLTRFGSSLLYVRLATTKTVTRIGWRKRSLQQRVKPAGGRRDPARRVWMPRRDFAERLDLMPRAVGG